MINLQVVNPNNPFLRAPTNMQTSASKQNFQSSYNNVNSGGSINNPHAHAAYKNNSGSNSSAIRSFMKGNLKNQQ